MRQRACGKIATEAGNMWQPAHRWRHDLDLHGAWCQRGDLLGHAVGDAWEHGGAAAQHDVAVQVLPDVHVALHDGVEGGVVDAVGLHAHQAGLEQHLGAAEALVANGDDLQRVEGRVTEWLGF